MVSHVAEDLPPFPRPSTFFLPQYARGQHQDHDLQQQGMLGGGEERGDRANQKDGGLHCFTSSTPTRWLRCLLMPSENIFLPQWESSLVEQDLTGLVAQLGRASDSQVFRWGQNSFKRDQQYSQLWIYTLNGPVGLLTQKTKGWFFFIIIINRAFESARA